MERQSIIKGKGHPRLLILYNHSDSAGVFSFVCQPELERLVQHMTRQGYETIACNIDDDINRISRALVAHRPTLVLNLVNQILDRDIRHASIAGLLDLHGCLYVGSDPLTLSSCSDRLRTKLLLQNANILVPEFNVIRDVQRIPRLITHYPMIVTHPLDDIYDDRERRATLDKYDAVVSHVRKQGHSNDQPFLIEEHLPGRRIQCVLIGNKEFDILPLTERDYSNHFGPELSSPIANLAPLPLEIFYQIRRLAMRAFEVTGCRDVAQIDFVVTDDQCYVIGVRPVVDFFSGPFRIATNTEGQCLWDTMASLIHVTHKRLPAEKLRANPLPSRSRTLPEHSGIISQEAHEPVTQKHQYDASF